MNLLNNDILKNISQLDRKLPNKKTLNKSIEKIDLPKKKSSFHIVNKSNSKLDLFVETTGFNGIDYTGKHFSVYKKSDGDNLFFQNLWNKINESQSNFVLIKNTSVNGKSTWTKSIFEIKSDNKISFYIKEGITSTETLKSINKLYHILFSLESKAGKQAANKYLEGFLEEKCMTYSEYIQNLAA